MRAHESETFYVTDAGMNGGRGNEDTRGKGRTKIGSERVYNRKITDMRAVGEKKKS